MPLSRRSFFQALGIGAILRSSNSQPLLPDFRAGFWFEAPQLAGQSGLIRLDRNENPYGPSPKVGDAIRGAVSASNRYTRGEYDALLDAIAHFHGLNPEQVLLGCGSTELLRAAVAAFLSPARKVILPVPTFEAVEHYARSTGAQIVGVPLNREFVHDLESMRARIDSSTGLVYICNPNNPTASLTPRKQIETFLGKLRASAYIVIDEAYHQYAGESSATYSSFIDRPLADDRVVVTRTFSKVYGLAGLRLGYAIAAPKTIQQLRKYVTLDGINAIAVRAGIVALQDTDGLGQFVRRNENDRQEFINQAFARMLKPVDSHANFVMFDTLRPADDVIQHFRSHGILLGPRFPSMTNHVRVSLGTPAEMAEFWRVWDLMPKTNMEM
jgi:histidinol-phosphate aminotransferase